jgi:hypothetical protein
MGRVGDRSKDPFTVQDTASTSDDDDDDEGDGSDPEDAREEAPDLYRNSALGMCVSFFLLLRRAHVSVQVLWSQ